MNSYKLLTAASLMLVFLAACGSSGVGDIFGGSGSKTYEIQGTVSQVDANNRSILLNNVSGYTSMLSSGGNSVRVYYDESTTVAYQGSTYRPEDLEPGDRVAIRVDESGNALRAESMTVLQDVSGGTSSPATSSIVRGSVRSVDTARRTIELESTNWISGFNTGAGTGTGGRMIIQYGTNTSVEVTGQLHPITGLERGDVVDVQVSGSGSNLFAERIVLVRNVRN